VGVLNHEWTRIDALGPSSPRSVLQGNFAGQFASREAAKSAKENAKSLCLLCGGHWASRGRKSAGEGLSVARAFQPEICPAGGLCVAVGLTRSREGKPPLSQLKTENWQLILPSPPQGERGRG
jgi:hypothetical protein